MVLSCLIVLIPQNGDTALMEASRQGHPDIIRELLSGGAHVDLHNMVRHIIN